MIGKIQRVPLREVWRHEAHDFTRWLQENIDVLSDVLGLTLSSAEREQAAGSLSVDITAEDEAGNAVVIENQLERSNHDHLGKLVTYLASFDAKTAIWIVADPRPEHVTAVSWLNEASEGSFYLVKVESIRIGDSPPAPLLTLIVGPSEESRNVGQTKKERAERHTMRETFWGQLLEAAKRQTSLHANITPGTHGSLCATAGRQGLSFNYVIGEHESRVELYIDRGKEKEDENVEIFDHFYGHKNEVESSFGEPLEWQRLEGKRACRIRKVNELGGYRDQEKWPEINAAMIESMIRLENSLRPHIETLDI